jgi:hypothetical protein
MAYIADLGSTRSSPRKSSITHCYFGSRAPHDPIRKHETVFKEEADGNFSIVMDGYAVVPLEDYEKHRDNAAEALRIYRESLSA